MNGPRSVLVIGSGLAGSAAAAVVARRGWAVTLVAPDAGRGGASAVPAAVMAPPVGSARDPLSRIRRRGVACTRAWLARLEWSGLDAGRLADGVVIRPSGERARARHARIDEVDAHVRRLPARAGEVRHALGACISPIAFAGGLRAIAGARLDTVNAPVARLARDGRRWVALDASDQPLAHADETVVAAGAATGTLLPCVDHLLHPARGQATAFAAAAATPAHALPLSGGGYITPAVDGLHWVGATLQRGERDMTPRSEDDAANLDFACEHLALDTRPAVVEHFVGLRATTPNRIPLAGACANGVWVSAGHGAHGLITACLAAHLVADALAGRNHPWLRLTAPNRRRDGAGR